MFSSSPAGNTMSALGAVVVGETVAIPDVVNKIGADGSFVDDAQGQLQALVSALVATLEE